MSNTQDIRHLIGVALRRKWWILTCSAIGVLGAMVALVVIIGLLALVASRDDPMGLGRTVQQSFTKGLDTIFGDRKPRDHRS